MTTPASGQISMGDVNLETNLSTEMSNFFATSLVGGLGGLMYHNLAMGPSNTQTAKQAIYDPFSIGASGTNLNLTAWYNYSQTPNLTLTFTITNNNADNNIDYIISLFSPSLGSYTQIYMSNISPASSTTETDYTATVTVNPSNFPDGLYKIAFEATASYLGPPPPPGGPILVSASAFDPDGAGTPGNVRIVPPSIPSFNQNTPLSRFFLVYGNIAGATAGIYVNKRTEFTVTFS